MLQKSRAIVLQVTEYSEASIIVHAYTDANGLQSFLVNSVRKQRPRFAPNLFQPLTLLDIVAYFKKPGGLHRVSEVIASPSYKSIPYDIVKTTVAMFLGEVLYRSIREEESNPELFRFAESSFLLFDLLEEQPVNFHLVFMIRLTRFLGFYPSGRYGSTGNWFDLKEGQFISSTPMQHPYFLDKETSQMFDRLLDITLEESGNIQMEGRMRRKLLEALVLYYELHHTQGTQIRSHHVLADVLG